MGFSKSDGGDTNQTRLDQDEETFEELFSRPHDHRGKSEKCDFCEITNGHIERYVVFEDEFSIAFLDRKPVFIGHTLLIPKIHTETISDLPRKLVGPLFTNMQLVSRAVQSALSSDDIFVAINNNVSQSVPHLHIHVVPRKFGDGLKGFFWPRTKYSSEDQMNDTKSAIMEAVRSLRAS